MIYKTGSGMRRPKLFMTRAVRNGEARDFFPAKNEYFTVAMVKSRQ